MTQLNDDTTLKGLEGEWTVKDNTLIVYITYTNYWQDILSDCLIIPTLDGYHMGLKPYGAWLASWVRIQRLNNPEIEKVILIGCSMGGGIVMIAANLLDDVTKVISIGGLNTTFKIHLKAELWINRGDIVPYLGLWFRRPIKKYTDKKWQWPIKAHCSYDVGKVINNIIK